MYKNMPREMLLEIEDFYIEQMVKHGMANEANKGVGNLALAEAYKEEYEKLMEALVSINPDMASTNPKPIDVGYLSDFPDK